MISYIKGKGGGNIKEYSLICSFGNRKPFILPMNNL